MLLGTTVQRIMLPSIAINETAKSSAFPLIDAGYMQSRHSVHCPICRAKYLLLLDALAYQTESFLSDTLEATALSYFAEKLRETHGTGHQENKLVMT